MCDSFGLGFVIALSVAVAYGIALCLHKTNVWAQKFGPKFKTSNASATGIKTFLFFVFLL